MYPRLLEEVDTDDFPSPEKLEIDDTVEKVRSGEGQEEIAGVGERDGDGERSRGRVMVMGLGRERPKDSVFSAIATIFARTDKERSVEMSAQEMTVNSYVYNRMKPCCRRKEDQANWRTLLQGKGDKFQCHGDISESELI